MAGIKFPYPQLKGFLQGGMQAGLQAAPSPGLSRHHLCKVEGSGSNTLNEVSPIKCFKPCPSSPWELSNITSPLVFDSKEQPNSMKIGCFCIFSSLCSAVLFVWWWKPAPGAGWSLWEESRVQAWDSSITDLPTVICSLAQLKAAQQSSCIKLQQLH